MIILLLHSTCEREKTEQETTAANLTPVKSRNCALRKWGGNVLYMAASQAKVVKILLRRSRFSNFQMISVDSGLLVFPINYKMSPNTWEFVLFTGQLIPL
ncbi:hypothetical protein PoB_003098700 [Plakobranchus ocellatus]|uniref:Uncharacterized protein n=1 Tax=Plakobranchus ocellatus TaxID=259542 RepID=A0AAV4AC60_9GAST|nr:hypothetical protein PoB_003098700 [Plakobranchus ocellatus]